MLREIVTPVRLAAASLAALAFVAVQAPTPAEACGGFFCSQVPMDQQGEQIVFTVREGTITATIQIAYVGEAADFAWVIPVASKPEIAVAPQELFNQLRFRTQPQFYLEWDYENGGECGGWWMYDMDGAPTAAGGGDDGVTVVDQNEVGPYQTVVLEATDAGKLHEWLSDNGFDQPESSIPLIDHYLKQDMLFVALKLKQDATAGDIQPIALTFEEANPCVPLVLTQIAAVPDMPVLVYTLGDHRVVPTNWFHVTINEKKIDWLNYGSNYNDVVTQAVNEAAGHAFVTEFAGAIAELSGLDQALYFDGKFDTDKLLAITNAATFVQELLMQGFPRDTMMQGLLRKHIPMPQALIDQGIEERSFYNNLDAYADVLADQPFDAAAFVADLQEKVIAPLQWAQGELNGARYMTRLYTTVSPDEMTRDPLFAYNPLMPDVSNVHTAKAAAICGTDDGGNPTMDSVTITLESGESWTIEGPIDPWGGPISGGDVAPDEPSAKLIELFGEGGESTVVDPALVANADRDLDTQASAVVIEAVKTLTPPIVGGTGSDAGPSGCAAGDQPGAPWAGLLAMLALLALVAVRRRA